MSTTPIPTQRSDFPAWYAEVVRRAGLAEHAPVRGAMVIKPYGYAIWEAIQRELDDRIKATGHENYYFPDCPALKGEPQCFRAFGPLGNRSKPPGWGRQLSRNCRARAEHRTSHPAGCG